MTKEEMRLRIVELEAQLAASRANVEELRQALEKPAKEAERLDAKVRVKLQTRLDIIAEIAGRPDYD